MFRALAALNSRTLFTTTAEILARSLAKFYCQYADRQMNLKFMRGMSEREWAIRPFVIVKNKFSVFISHVIKTKNRNRLINKFKDLGYDR